MIQQTFRLPRTIPLAVLQRRGAIAQAELLDEVAELVVARFRADLGDRPVRADDHALGYVEPVFIPVPRRRHAGVFLNNTPSAVRLTAAADASCPADSGSL